MTTNQTKHSANTYWEDVYYHISENTLPTVTTDSLVMHNDANATVNGTVVAQGSSDLIEYGFVWATHDNPTTADHKVVVGSGSFTGSYSNTINSLPFPSTVFFAAYATNAIGTTYGSVLSGSVMICFAAGTLVNMADGSKKKIEEVQYSDDLLVWNFDKGGFSQAKPVWMVQPFKANYYGLLRFDNGAELRTVADGRGHRIFNIEKNEFTYSMGEDTPIGTTTHTEYKIIRLVDKQIIRKDTMFYNIVTHTHFNIFANDILTSTGLNNLYPMGICMRFIKDDRKLMRREEFSDISDEIFVGLRLAEQGRSSYNIKEKIKMMVERQLV